MAVTGARVCGNWRGWLVANRLASVAILLSLVLLPPVAWTAEPVIDDEQLARGFAVGLGRLVDAAARTTEAAADATPVLAPLATDAARMQLQAGVGCTVPVPAAETLCALSPERSLYDTVTPAIVVVGSVFKCDRCKDWHLGQTASGWILSADGLVVTNHHVLDRPGGNHYGVMTSDGQVYAVTGVVAADPVGDAAVLRIDTRGRRLPSLAVGQPADCGDPVTIISHPKGRFYSLTTGVVSRYHRQRQPAAGPAAGRPAAVWMSVTADYAVGSSGGPVLNAAGEVVGMVSRTVSVTAGAAAPGPSGGQPQGAGTGEKPTRPAGMPGHEQMVFKDCVSAATLQALLSR